MVVSEQKTIQPDSRPEQDKGVTSPSLQSPKSDDPKSDIQRATNQTQRSVETSRTPGNRVIDALRTLDHRFENPQCPQCGGRANLAINNEGLVIICAIGGCKKSERVDVETLQHLIDHLSVRCFSCTPPGRLKSVERNFGNLLICENPHCGRNNTWQGISDRIGKP